ncbi:hypothetical protein L1887_18702 [Cichorium endivia]|nr:hypothetical protein L1887_18702 [Cichorium endivia]
MTAFFGGAMAQSSGCNSVLATLSPCINYLSGNASTPTSGCCSQFMSVAQSQPQCLCQVVNGNGSVLGVTINQTQASGLPNACNVQTSPTSQCNGNSPSTDTGSSDASSIKFTTIPIVIWLLVAMYATVF